MDWKPDMVKASKIGVVIYTYLFAMHCRMPNVFMLIFLRLSQFSLPFQVHCVPNAISLWTQAGKYPRMHLDEFINFILFENVVCFTKPSTCQKYSAVLIILAILIYY